MDGLEETPDVSGIDTEVETPETESSAGNPNWDEMLSQIPDSFHHLITPHLTKWDQGVQQRFQQIQQDNSGYAPYKDIMEQGVDPQAIQQAMSVMGMLNDKPDQFFREMQTFYKDDPRFAQSDVSQGQQEYDLSEEDQQPSQYNIETDPRFIEMKNNQDIMANFLSNQVQEKENAAEDAALDNEMTALTQKYGEYDQEYVLGLAQGGVDLEVAVQRYHAMVNGIRTAPTPGSNLPRVVTPGGGVPSTAIDPAAMNNSDTKSLVASYLATLNQS